MTAPGVSIIPLRWWQIDACLEVEHRVFPDTAWSRESFWGELARVPESRYYVAAVQEPDAAGADPAVLGYAGLSAVPPDADVQTVAVAPGAQRNGLGRALLVELLAESARRGCSTVMLEVRADNEPAISLYRSMGFESVSRRRDYYGRGLDAVIMRRREPLGGSRD